MRRATALVLLGIVLAAVLTLALPVAQWRSGRLPVPELSLLPGDGFADRAQRLWIDSDAACGAGRRTDPDDCFAILMLMQAGAIEVAGISTVFGNVAQPTADHTVRELLAAMASANAPPAVHSGSASALQAAAPAAENPAHGALRQALAQGPLTIVALGPLTNLAAALREQPQLRRHVVRIIAVMGRRPGHWFHPAEGAPGAMLLGHGPIFRDLNLTSDALAAAEIVRMRLPLVLVPYDAARRIELTRADLDRMRSRGGAAAWVAARAEGWLEHWRDEIGRNGFYPFDALAAAFALRPDLLRCARVPIRLGEDKRLIGRFREPPALLAGPEVLDDDSGPDATLASGEALYCPEVAEGMQGWLSARLAGAKS